MLIAPSSLVLAAIALAALSGLAGFVGKRGSRAGMAVALVAMLSAAALGLAGSFLGLLGGATKAIGAVGATPLVLPWNGEALVDLDPLSAFFLLPVFLVGGLGAWYERGYRPACRHPRTARRTTVFYGFLVAGLALLLTARHSFVFLLGWEGMALSSFFLISLDDEREESRRAGLIYIIATHVGTLLLFGLFAYWRHLTGSYELVRPPAGLIDAGAANLLFLLVLLAFGLKAGIMPLHFWLPGAHAAAPSHVSAMLSGVVLKMGIYGIMRFLLLLPSPPALWGLILLALGAASSILGVAFAIAQHDLKRLLAYHSVENIGIIVMGIGLALLGTSYGHPVWVLLGAGGALLHVWNHALFKSLLFLGAGSVVERTGTRRIDALGGLAASLPWTAALFLAGAAAISGLPPLNGFVSEFLVYFGAFKGATLSSGGSAAAMVVVPVLAATGALALACFVKVYGAVFLGQARGGSRPVRGESPPSMILPMAVLAALCALIGLLPVLAARLLDPAVAFWCAASGQVFGPAFGAASEVAPLDMIQIMNIIIVIVAVPVAIVLFVRSRRRPAARTVGTWDCGYAAPAPRMQYTASSFARSLTAIFGWILRPRVEEPGVEGAFPRPASLESHVDDLALDRLILPFSRFVERRFGWFRRFQQGLTQNYLLYILVAVLVLLGTLIPFGQLITSMLAG